MDDTRSTGTGHEPGARVWEYLSDFQGTNDWVTAVGLGDRRGGAVPVLSGAARKEDG